MEKNICNTAAFFYLISCRSQGKSGGQIRVGEYDAFRSALLASEVYVQERHECTSIQSPVNTGSQSDQPRADSNTVGNWKLTNCLAQFRLQVFQHSRGWISRTRPARK